MLDFLLGNKKLKNVAYKLFSKIIEQSRNPYFYSNLEVEDNLDGRFDLMAIHMIILLDKLDRHGENKKTAKVKRILQETMFDNLDLTLREIGVGDLGVGKKIKVMAEAFYGRMKAYQKAFESGNEEVILEITSRNLYRDKKLHESTLLEMSNYIRHQYEKVSEQSINEIMSGVIHLNLPDGETNG